jgi:hypothetical protein
MPTKRKTLKFIKEYKSALNIKAPTSMSVSELNDAVDKSIIGLPKSISDKWIELKKTDLQPDTPPLHKMAEIGTTTYEIQQLDPGIDDLILGKGTKLVDPKWRIWQRYFVDGNMPKKMFMNQFIYPMLGKATDGDWHRNPLNGYLPPDWYQYFQTTGLMFKINQFRKHIGEKVAEGEDLHHRNLKEEDIFFDNYLGISYYHDIKGKKIGRMWWSPEEVFEKVFEIYIDGIMNPVDDILSDLSTSSEEEEGWGGGGGIPDDILSDLSGSDLDSD